jgi:hypothetical protein
MTTFVCQCSFSTAESANMMFHLCTFEHESENFICSVNGCSSQCFNPVDLALHRQSHGVMRAEPLCGYHREHLARLTKTYGDSAAFCVGEGRCRIKEVIPFVTTCLLASASSDMIDLRLADMLQVFERYLGTSTENSDLQLLDQVRELNAPAVATLHTSESDARWMVKGLLWATALVDAPRGAPVRGCCSACGFSCDVSMLLRCGMKLQPEASEERVRRSCGREYHTYCLWPKTDLVDADKAIVGMYAALEFARANLVTVSASHNATVLQTAHDVWLCAECVGARTAVRRRRQRALVRRSHSLLAAVACAARLPPDGVHGELERSAVLSARSVVAVAESVIGRNMVRVSRLAPAIARCLHVCPPVRTGRTPSVFSDLFNFSFDDEEEVLL